MRYRTGLLAAVVLLVAGCGNDPYNPTTAKGYFGVTQVSVNGRSVSCITWTNRVGKAGGLSCDWQTAR